MMTPEQISNEDKGRLQSPMGPGLPFATGAVLSSTAVAMKMDCIFVCLSLEDWKVCLIV
jgi:hypothetical protein